MTILNGSNIDLNLVTNTLAWEIGSGKKNTTTKSKKKAENGGKRKLDFVQFGEGFR